MAAAGLGILVASGSWYALASSAVAVDVVTVARSAPSDTPAPTLTAGGYVRAARVVYVVPKVAGRIASLHVAEGDVVQAGDLIAVLDGRDFEQEVAEARANYELARASLRALELGSRPQEIAESQARVQAVALARDRSARDLARARALFDAGVISARDFDQADTDYRVQEKNVDVARQSAALVEAGPRQEAIQAATAAVEAARARWLGAGHRLEYATVRAPVAGRVLKKFRNAGDFVSPEVPYLEGAETVAVGSPIVSLGDVDHQEVSADVNETDIVLVSLHQPVLIAPNAYPDEVLHGSVTEVSPRADKNKNTIEVKVSVEEAARVLPYDMSVKLTFLAQARPQASGPAAIRIPATAVMERGGQRYVFVALDSRAVARAVEVGARDRDLVVVARGLEDGERVITSHLDVLKDGSRITAK